MPICEKSGKELPKRGCNFSGFECREKERFCCLNFSHHFIYGTNCILLRPQIDVAAILGVKK